MYRAGQVINMGTQISSRDGRPGNAQLDAPRTGRHARPVSPSASASSDIYRDRGIERIRAADRVLRDAHARVRSAGVDSDAVNTAFTIARDTLNEAREIVREARKELILVHHEYDELHRRLANQGRYPVAADPVVPDTPGLDLCPDPGTAQAPAEFMDALRAYRIWAGKPSYRAMESIIKNQCSQHFASSTLQAALTGNDLPALQLVQAVITACGGSDAHQQTFTSTWRRLTMPQQDDDA
jgi:hypothetical protein